MAANFLSTTWLRPFNDPAFWQGVARGINPGFRAHGIGAKVVRIIRETTDTKTFVLQTNRGFPGKRWPGHRAGQHCTISVEIGGRTLSRVFSISSAPTPDGLISLTVKRNRATLQRISVSAWMFDHLSIGARLTVSPPEGDFVLSNHSVTPLVMLSAGSGITPVMAMLRQLFAQRFSAPITFVHVCKNASELIFAQELQSLAQQMPTLTVKLHLSDAEGRFDVSTLLATHPALLSQALYLCGPTSFSDAVCNTLREAGRHEPVQQESYGGFKVSDGEHHDESHEVRLQSAKQAFTVPAKQLLLEALESAGLNPAFGCRIGICKSCQCLKRSGVVKNLRTGELSDAPNEWIQLCVSSARSPLELSL